DDLVVSKVMLETQLKMKDKMPVICLTAGMATIYDLANKRYDYNEMKKKLQQAKKPIIKKN
ncbi:MAG: hypothetical protein NTY48_03900, partial [Candidatus Diapherotrites archaeon]|nr:hypothetical protein [Candidatus Diapherotrites archaeon]